MPSLRDFLTEKLGAYGIFIAIHGEFKKNNEDYQELNLKKKYGNSKRSLDK